MLKIINKQYFLYKYKNLNQSQKIEFIKNNLNTVLSLEKLDTNVENNCDIFLNVLKILNDNKDTKLIVNFFKSNLIRYQINDGSYKANNNYRNLLNYLSINDLMDLYISLQDFNSIKYLLLETIFDKPSDFFENKIIPELIKNNMFVNLILKDSTFYPKLDLNIGHLLNSYNFENNIQKSTNPKLAIYNVFKYFEEYKKDKDINKLLNIKKDIDFDNDYIKSAINTVYNQSIFNLDFNNLLIVFDNFKKNQIPIDLDLYYLKENLDKIKLLHNNKIITIIDLYEKYENNFFNTLLNHKHPLTILFNNIKNNLSEQELYFIKDKFFQYSKKNSIQHNFTFLTDLFKEIKYSLPEKSFKEIIRYLSSEVSINGKETSPYDNNQYNLIFEYLSLNQLKIIKDLMNEEVIYKNDFFINKYEKLMLEQNLSKLEKLEKKDTFVVKKNKI